jgi:hypothetical protein
MNRLLQPRKDLRFKILDLPFGLPPFGRVPGFRLNKLSSYLFVIFVPFVVKSKQCLRGSAANPNRSEFADRGRARGFKTSKCELR